jgi:hypothetical protein
MFAFVRGIVDEGSITMDRVHDQSTDRRVVLFTTLPL